MSNTADKVLDGAEKEAVESSSDSTTSGMIATQPTPPSSTSTPPNAPPPPPTLSPSSNQNKSVVFAARASPGQHDVPDSDDESDCEEEENSGNGGSGGDSGDSSIIINNNSDDGDGSNDNNSNSNSSKSLRQNIDDIKDKTSAVISGAIIAGSDQVSTAIAKTSAVVADARSQVNKAVDDSIESGKFIVSHNASVVVNKALEVKADILTATSDIVAKTVSVTASVKDEIVSVTSDVMSKTVTVTSNIASATSDIVTKSVTATSNIVSATSDIVNSSTEQVGKVTTNVASDLAAAKDSLVEIASKTKAAVVEKVLLPVAVSVPEGSGDIVIATVTSDNATTASPGNKDGDGDSPTADLESLPTTAAAATATASAGGENKIKRGVNMKEIHVWQSQSLLSNGSWGFNNKQMAPHFFESLNNSESENFPDVRSSISWQWVNEWSVDKSMSSAYLCQFGECDGDGWMYAPTFEQLNKMIATKTTQSNSNSGSNSNNYNYISGNFNNNPTVAVNQRRKRRWIRKMMYDSDNIDIYWFAREVRSVTIRNFCCSGESGTSRTLTLPTTFLEMHCAESNNNSNNSNNSNIGVNGAGGNSSNSSNSNNISSDNLRLFTSATVANTCNPTWVIQEQLFKSLPQIAAFGNLREFVLVVKDLSRQNSDGSCPQMSVRVDISKLTCLKAFDASKVSTLPINTIFFAGDDGVYVTESLYKVMLASGIFPVQQKGGDTPQRDNSKNVVIDEDYFESRQALVGFVDTINDSARRAEELQSGLEGTIRKDFDTVSSLSTSVNIKQKQLFELQRQLQLEEAMVAEELMQEQADLLALGEFTSVRKELEDCSIMEQANKQIEASINSCRSDLIKAQFLLEARQLRLIYELQHIYPIEELPSGERTIRGMELPFDLMTKDDDIVSTALGYVVHLLLLTSKYLEVPLRYTLMYHASRSFVKDPVYNSGNTTLPLFRKGNEREKFERAIQWLKKDIEQLLQSKGLPYDPAKDILYNIKQFFECKLCNSLAL